MLKMYSVFALLDWLLRSCSVPYDMTTASYASLTPYTENAHALSLHSTCAEPDLNPASNYPSTKAVRRV
jgi:hypothetical protein